MAIEIVVPRLGWSMEEGTFGEWLKPNGATVARGEPLFVLEGEKSAQDIEAVDAGILRIPPHGPRPGETVKVGQVLAWFVQPGEEPPTGGLSPAPSLSAASNSAATPAQAAPPAVALAATAAPHPHPAPVPTGVTTGSQVASPRARRAARDLGLDLGQIAGTGVTGRIRERDVVSAAQTSPTAKAPSAARVSPPAGISSIRKTIAARMLESSTQTAPVTLHRRCDASNLVNLRRQFQSLGANSAPPPPTYTDLIVKLVACVLAEFPEIRTQWLPAGPFLPPHLDVAVAVDTPQGLLAPVLRQVETQTVRQLSANLRSLAERARGGQLSPDELSGGCFTITNLGTLGVEHFTPIINLPQVAILGLGRIAPEPVAMEGELLLREQLPLSLTFDHRIVDGGPAARFLAAVTQAIENPGPWLMP
jgi:pyruvate dehydrogenase E2 component (dihydrolipoamide acetyltransferase)